MPLALLFMIAPLLFAGGSAGTDLLVGAIATGRVTGGGVEAPRADTAGRGQDGLAGLVQVFVHGLVAPDEPGLQETELHARGQPARHLLLGQRVHLELEAVLRALVGLLLLRDVARLVVDDDEALGRLVHAIESPADFRRPQGEAELALHLAGLLPRGLLLVIEARERLHPGALALLLVLAREEALVAPGIVEGLQEVLERGEVPYCAAAQIALPGLV